MPDITGEQPKKQRKPRAPRTGNERQRAFKSREFAVDIHPQKQRIIDLMLAGKTMRYIESLVAPPISFMALQRYKTKVIKPMQERAEMSAKILGIDRAIAARTRLEEDPAALRAEANQLVRQAVADQEILTIRDNRVKAQQERHRRLNMIVESRAAEMKDSVPGGESGFLTRDYKNVGDEVREVYKFDAPLAQSFLDHEKQIAIEMGQWQEAAPANMSIQIVCPSTADPSNVPRISFASADQIEDDFVDIGLIQAP